MYLFLGGAQPQRPPPGFDGKVENTPPPIRRGAWTSFLPHELSPPPTHTILGQWFGKANQTSPPLPWSHSCAHGASTIPLCSTSLRYKSPTTRFDSANTSIIIMIIPNFINKKSSHGNTIWFVPRRVSLFSALRGFPAQHPLLEEEAGPPPPWCPYKGPAPLLLPLSVRRPRWSVAVARVPIGDRIFSLGFLRRHSLCNHLYVFGVFTSNSNLPRLPPSRTTPSNASPSKSG